MAKKHDDIINKKKVGDTWHTVDAPEELRYWSAKSPWPKDAFKKYGGRGGTKWLCSPVMVFSYIMGHLKVYVHDILGRLRFL